MNYISPAIVLDVCSHHSDIKEYLLEIEFPRKYKPGSFVQLSLDQVDASSIWPESRTFSIASFKEDKMRFFIKKQGKYTHRIFNELKVGSRCTVKFPFGELFDRKTLDDTHIFLAGGVGITPYFGLIEYFDRMERLENLYLLYSVKIPEHFLYLDYLKSKLNERLFLFTTQYSSKEFTDRRIQFSDISDIANYNDHIYICGNKSFNQYFKTNLKKLGYNEIHMDEWE